MDMHNIANNSPAPHGTPNPHGTPDSAPNPHSAPAPGTIPANEDQPVPPFAFPITVGADAIDELNHVNNAVYLTWVQAAITAFWEATAPDDYVGKLAWIAYRHDITYRREALLGDALVAEVKVVSFGGSRSNFEVRFRRGEDVIAEVKTTLCCIDRETRALFRIKDDLARHFRA